MQRNQALTAILDELDAAERKFPGWPVDQIHAAAVVAEECGELVQACLQATYEPELNPTVQKEAIQTAAMAWFEEAF